ncbi:MAG: hypothetical protein ABI047_04610 [Jatrophihabitantaceae bacterium]
MRRFWTLVLTPVLALAFFLAGSPAANAFGSEVLGCAWNGGSWVANNCGSSTGNLAFSPHNLSGSYSYSWTVTYGASTVTTPCASGIEPCILSGCTATSSSCTVYADNPYPLTNRVITARLQLTQSGQSRTITASGTAYSSKPACPLC